MARPKMPEIDLTRNNPRWHLFGKWVRSMRLNKHVRLKDAAKIVGVSPKHFSRYESGTCSVPPERIAGLAKAIKMPLDRTLMRAGYKVFDRTINPEFELRSLWEYILSGDLSNALRILIELHFDLEEGSEQRMSRPTDGNTCDAFANALLAIERLPGWLCGDLIPFIERRQKKAKQVRDFELAPEHQAKIRKRIKKAASKPITYWMKE